MPRQFVKIWTDALDDDFFTGLSWTEIGIITKLFLWCKVTTDSGEICCKNVSTLSAMMGGDRRTLSKFLQKCQELNKFCDVTEGETIRVTIRNYTEWQEVRADGKVKKRAGRVKKRTKMSQKSPYIRPEKIREDKTEIRPYQSEEFSAIIDDLNLRAGTNYKPTSKNTQDLIRARLKEGFSVDDFKEVNRKKCDDWLGDPEHQKYLRPETLYCAKHFEGYLNQPEKVREKSTYARVKAPAGKYDGIG